MDVEIIRKLKRSEPFKPFRLILRDGRDLPVEQASFLAVSPTGGAIAYALPRGGFEFVLTEAINDAVVDETIQSLRRRAQ
jgi:hypothetical protein